ncbi:SAGA-associated factor 29 homolog [Elysia marginata]|uniref:SAGA-associated factor 29 homolog n=1 Tax=Elysia marginata TaxID=1093978 RepID=A0AAV4F3P6_9GAST|nr:SAGA-associated factor 29 homolog [Elysia marginata]
MPRASKGKGGANGGDKSESKGGDSKSDTAKSEAKADSKGEPDNKADTTTKGDKAESSLKGSGNSSQSPSTCAPSDELRGAVGGAPASSEEKVQGLLGELFRNVKDIQVERDRAEHNLTNIKKTHEKVKEEGKDSGRPKQIMRRGVLMSQLQQNATTLPLWVSKPGESPPPLCGAVSADNNYISQAEDKVAARVKGQDGGENWILAEVVNFNAHTGKYEVDDVDAEEGKERHSISRRRVVPLPIWKANPETDPDALFPKKALVLALYPQTTCFYRALVEDPPKTVIAVILCSHIQFKISL